MVGRAGRPPAMLDPAIAGDDDDAATSGGILTGSAFAFKL